MKKNFALLFILMVLVGCQTPAVKQESVAYVAADPTKPVSNEWLGFCRPILNEIGEVVQNKNGPNSVRSEFHLLSADEMAWINDTYIDTNCKEPWGSSKVTVNCSGAVADAEGFKACKITKEEMAARDAKHVAASNKSKTCKLSNWAADQWLEVTTTPCGGSKEFVYSLTPENELHTLKLKSEAGGVTTLKFKRK